MAKSKDSESSSQSLDTGPDGNPAPGATPDSMDDSCGCEVPPRIQLHFHLHLPDQQRDAAGVLQPVTAFATYRVEVCLRSQGMPEPPPVNLDPT